MTNPEIEARALASCESAFLDPGDSEGVPYCVFCDAEFEAGEEISSDGERNSWHVACARAYDRAGAIEWARANARRSRA